MFKKDSIWIGIGIGLVIPLVFFGLVTLIAKSIKIEEHTQSLLYIIGIGINALIMRNDMNHGLTKRGTGILLISFIYAFLFMYYKIKIAG